MGKLTIKLMAILCCMLCGIEGVVAQNKFIPVHINSGNPAFPFPQFLEYKEGKSLAKYNAEGVTHADMEKTMREAYEIMSHRCRYTGTVVSGVPYISFNPQSLSEDEKDGSFSPKCSEGDGYILLASAIFADQPTFNGLWMLIHDSKIPKVKKYSDGKILFQDYPFSPGMACCFTSDEKIEGPAQGPNGVYPMEGSATDGDDDIALALLIAYKQWGEWMMQDGKAVLDYDGNPISYRQIAKDYISAFVDTFMYTSINGDGTIYKGGHTSGNIGIDGYIHGGNKGGDMTQWRQTQTDYPDVSQSANIGNADAFFDYAAPAYYNEFAKWLEEDNVENPDPKNAWRIQQYKRGEASCDWLMGQAYEQGYIPSIGKFAFNGDDTKPTFTRGLNGEDFRLGWRTILNYVWHGNPETTWNPKTHQVEAGGNTFERDMGLRFAEFLKDAPGQGQSPNSNPNSGGQSTGRCITAGASPDGGQPYWSGVCNIVQQYSKEGDVDEFYPTNFTVGCAAPSAVVYAGESNENLEFLGDMYREAELRWDGNDCGISASSPKRYEESTPKYFHGWFRNLGLLVNSGNFHAPSTMKAAPNMKVYMSVDKTYCYVDDKVEYTVVYRNYGSKTATDVVIETALDPNYEVVAITRGKGTVSQGKSITWNIGEVPGFKTGELEATIDSVSFIVVAKDTLNPRICLTSTISTKDNNNKFEDWTSNEYPNHATYTMERNCVDILPSRTLQIKKTASRKTLNPNNIVKFTIEFENKSLGEASWLNGGRNNVRLSYANYLAGEDASTFIQGYRLWNSATEAYINTGNYRCSFFMYDAAAIGVYDPVTNPTGWGVFDDGQAADRKKYGLNVGDDTLKFTYKRVPYYEDPVTGKRCNQRLITQFPSTVMAPSSWVFQKIATDNGGGEGNGSGFCFIHKGIGGPFFLRNGLRIKAGNSDLQIGKKFYDDWSYEKLHVPTGQASTMQGSPLFLLTPCYAIPDSVYEVDKHGRDVCDIKGVDGVTYDRILVEEFDGYTWRRILGRAPLPGREANDVTIIDTIPYELEFFAWVDSTALKDENENRIKAQYIPAPEGSTAYSGIIKWTTPVMQIGEKDKLVYTCTARDFGCGKSPQPDDIHYKNVAWISSATDSPDSSQVFLTTTCEEIPEYSEEQESLFKRSDVKYADVGESVHYTVSYINNTGTHVDADCSSTTGWIPLKGSSLPKIDGGYIHMSTETSFMLGPEYSYGKNGDVYLKLDNCDRQVSETWVVLRYDKGCNAAPGEPGFKGLAVRLKPFVSSIKGAFSCEVYDNNKLLPLGEFDDDMTAYRGDAANPLFKISVADDKLYLFINDEEDDWQSPTKTWKGLSAAGPGYFGVYVKGKDGSSHLKQFITDLDYAFNVTLADSLPKELGNISNMKLTGTGVDETGSYDEAKNYITWPTVAKTVETAIAPGDSVVGTFDAEVIACGDHKYINNTAIGTVYGLNRLVRVQTINCGKEEDPECDLTDAVAELSVEEICEGDSAYIRAVPTPKSKGYTYEFFNGKTSLNDDKPIKVDSFPVKEAGSYSVTVYNEEIPGCKISSKSVKLSVNPLPDVSLDNGVALCDGESLDLSKAKIEGYDLNWYSDDVAAFEVTDLNIDGKDVLGAYFYTATDKTTKCVGKVQMMEVSKEAIPAVPTVTSPKEFAVGSGKEDITKLASSSDGRVVWYESETSTDSLRTPVTVSVAKEDTITYYVSAISKGGCESEREKVVIYITSSNKPKVSDTTLCVGETIDVTSLVEDPEAGQSLIWCDETGAPLSEPTPFEGTTPGEVKYYVKSTNGTAESDIAEITITTVGVGAAKTDNVSYCEDATAAKLVATTDDASLSTFVKADDPSKFEWYLGGVKLDESALIPSTSKVSSTTTNTYKVVPTYTIAKNHVCKGDTVDLDVTVKHIDAPAVNNVITYTLGDTLTDGSFKSLLTQDPSAITPGKDMTIVWYDENMSELKSEPIPSADKSMTTDVKLLYYVSQKDEDGCESVLSEVDVIISLTPVPKTRVARFCEDYLSTESIEDFVEKSDPSYSLKWYDADKSKGGLEISIPAISTKKTTKQPTDTTVYYVCQVDANGAESSTVPVKVIVYARPELKTHFDTVCSRAVNLDTMWIVSNDVSNVYSSFTDENGNPLNNYNAIDQTGHYNVTGYFKMPNDTSIKCESNSPKEIYVEIHRIDSLSIVGATSACPGSSVELNAVLKGDTYNSDITYTWNTNNNSTKADDGNFVSDPLNDPTKFEVTVSDGFCEKTVSHVVNIGQGEVKGSIVFTDEDGNTDAISAHGDPISFYSCGTKYSLFADLTSDANDFEWSTGEKSQAIQLDKEGEYVVTFTNECKTSQKVKVIDAGIKNNTVGKDTILCEGAKYAMALDFSCSETPDIEWKKDGVEAGTSTTISIASASASDAGKYTYTITNRNCVVEETYGTLTVSEAPKFTKIADDTMICDGSDAQIGLSELTPSTATIEWESNSSLTPAGLQAVASPTETTTYRFTVSQAGGCEVKDSIIVEVEEPIEFTVSPTDTIICMSSGSVRLFTNVSQGKPRKYTWTNEAGDVLATSPIYKAPTDKIGETVYTISLSNEICETVTAKSTIKVVGYPEIASVTQKGYRDVEIVPFKDNESANVMYKVDNSEFQESESFTDLKYGVHTAYIIDEYGCKSDFEFTTKAPDIEYPIVITPNGDGENDAFISEVVAEAYPDAVVTIYDRFGKKLTEIKGNESWDGTYLGRKMPSTDYWYEIWIDEIRKKYVGHFTLINE